MSDEFGSKDNLNFLKDDEIDEDALRKLTEMGFNDIERSRQALKLNNMNPINAIDWLLANEDNDVNDVKNCKLHANEMQSNEHHLNGTIKDRIEFKNTAFKKAFYDKNEIYERVPKLVESFRKFKR